MQAEPLTYVLPGTVDRESWTASLRRLRVWFLEVVIYESCSREGVHPPIPGGALLPASARMSTGDTTRQAAIVLAGCFPATEVWQGFGTYTRLLTTSCAGNSATMAIKVSASRNLAP